MIVCSYQQVDVAIVIVVASGDAHSKEIAADTGFRGNIRKTSIAITLVQCTLQRLCRLEKITRPIAHQVDIHPAVVVIVEEGTAWP